jgi:hypothetical protein
MRIVWITLQERVVESVVAESELLVVALTRKAFTTETQPVVASIQIHAMGMTFIQRIFCRSILEEFSCRSKK